MSEILTTVYLPSKGRFNLDNPAYAGPIELDMMGTKEEKMIFGSNAENVVDKMLKSVIKTEGIDIDELVPADKFFLLVQERIHTYGDEYHVSCACPYCGTVKEYKIKLSELEVRELPEDFSEPIEVELPIAKVKLGLRVLRNKDRDAIDREVRMKASKLSLNPSEMKFELRRVRSIVTIDGEEPKVGEAKKLFNSLKGKDIAAIDAALSKIDFGYDTTVPVVCPGCEAEIEAPFRMTSEFFRPKFD